MVASINYLYSQITKESSHIISLYNRVKSGAEGVKLKGTPCNDNIAIIGL